MVVLRGRAEFEAVLKQPNRRSTAHFTVWCRENGLGVPRLGIIAARKVARRAVDRNRGKRLIREVFRSLTADDGALDYVVRLRTDLRASGNEAIRGELQQAFATLRQRIQVAQRAAPN